MGLMQRTLLFSVMTGSALVGCHHAAPPMTQPIAAPATAEDVRGIREAFQKRDKGTVVGVVIAVLEENNLAAVGDVPVREFKTGQVVTFIDSNQAIIAVGTVVNTTADAVHVKYVPQGEMARAPREGDLAVRTQS